jgi:hypothetical protein
MEFANVLRHEVLPFFILAIDCRFKISNRPRMRSRERLLQRRGYEFSRNPQTHATDNLVGQPPEASHPKRADSEFLQLQTETFEPSWKDSGPEGITLTSMSGRALRISAVQLVPGRFDPGGHSDHQANQAS